MEAQLCQKIKDWKIFVSFNINDGKRKENRKGLPKEIWHLLLIWYDVNKEDHDSESLESPEWF
jgi:hypothetical protein